jgi:hypothetical protein
MAFGVMGAIWCERHPARKTGRLTGRLNTSMRWAMQPQTLLWRLPLVLDRRS